MKKILLLGGSAQQIIAIETAKRLGFYTILCDFLNDNPGQYVADKFYLISTTDKEAVLAVAKKEKIEGILAYASDPAAPTAAYIAEKLNLPGNPFESVDILCNKDKFRMFLRDNGYDIPIAKGYENAETAINDVNGNTFSFPIIIKPVDSSGSKGITVLDSTENLEQAIEFAFSYSRGNRIIIEEFILKKHPYLIGGDIFVLNGKVIMWGLMNCHRDDKVNPLVPVGKSYPPQLMDEDLSRIKMTLQKLVKDLKIKSGSMNVELVVDKNNRVFPLDIGPRSGGNMIPDLLGKIFDVDIAEMSIKVAMGMKINLEINDNNEYWATHNVHSRENGMFDSVNYSDEVKPYIIKECIYKQPGDKIEIFDNASKAVGIVFLKFNNSRDMDNILSNISDKITVVLK